MSAHARRAIARRTVLALGVAQMISWGITYYLIGGFGEAIAAELHWSRDIVYGGFSVSLLVMALASPLAGRLIDRHGGRRVMVAGAVVNAAGLAGLALCHSIALYFATWIVLGVAMRLVLYDAAFAALARIGGARARAAIAQITLLGGLSSTVFWPLGHAIATRVGWRGALFVYAGFALLTIPLHGTISNERHGATPAAASAPVAPPRATTEGDVVLASTLYAASTALSAFLMAAMSSHMIGILTGLGVVASTAVWVSTARGVGQSAARLFEVVFGRRFDPLTLTLAASIGIPLSFVAGLFSGRSTLIALGFSAVYGASNGMLTITRGTLPLVLFDPRSYGALVGRLLVPSFVLSAAAPVVYATILERFGEVAALGLSIGCGVLVLASAVLLQVRYRRTAARPPAPGTPSP